MNKFRSYLGLALAGFLAWIFLWPHSNGGGLKEPVRATHLDRTGISILAQNNDEAFQLLGRMQAYVTRCPDGPQTLFPGDCGMIYLAPSPYIMSVLQGDFEKHDPGVSDALDLYYETDTKDPAKEVMRRELDRRAISVYPKLLEDIRSRYVFSVYTLHALFVGAISIMVIFRWYVGFLLTWPLISLIAAIFKTARKVHEKV